MSIKYLITAKLLSMIYASNSNNIFLPGNMGGGGVVYKKEVLALLVKKWSNNKFCTCLVVETPLNTCFLRVSHNKHLTHTDTNFEKLLWHTFAPERYELQY